MLQNAYFLAKVGADTAENEQHFAEMLLVFLEMLPEDAEAAAAEEAEDAEAAEDAEGWVERFDRRGIEPFELFTSEFGQNVVKFQCILLEN